MYNEQDYEEKNKIEMHIINILLIIFIIPWFFIGFVFLSVGAFTYISDEAKSKNYVETEARLIDFIHEEYDEENGTSIGSGVYEYSVNGDKYTGMPKKISTEGSFESTIKVKYNPQNPSEYVMDAGWKNMAIYGIVINGIALAIFIIGRIVIKSKFANQ